MKIAFYMEDGLEQIVLTPETKAEASMLGKLHETNRELSVRQGSFYACNGGFMRHGMLYSNGYGDWGQNDDRSTILVLRPITHDREGKPVADETMIEMPVAEDAGRVT